MTNLSHITVTKLVDGKQVTKARYHTICEMADAGEALTPDTAKAFAAWQVAQKAAEKARKAFEESMAANDLDGATVDVEGIGSDLPLVPQGCVPVFGYNFGRIAVAAIRSEEKKGKAKTAKTSLKLKAKAAPVEASEPSVPEMPATLIRKGKKV